MKCCKRCDSSKELDDFYSNPKSSDGRMGICKECHKEAIRKNRLEKREYYREYDALRFRNDPKVRDRHKRYQSTEAGRQSLISAKERYSKNNPEKTKARNAVNNAVRDGKIFKPDRCNRCGHSVPSRILHAHHHDYSKHLDVEWICSPCHSKEHFPEFRNIKEPRPKQRNRS